MINSTATKISYSKRNGLLDLNINAGLVKERVRKNSLQKWNQYSEQPVPVINNLLANRLLNNQKENDFNNLASQIQIVAFRNGEIIQEPDGNFDYIYFPETAVFSQLSILEDGRTVETALVGNEGVIGISAVLGFNATNLWTQALVSGTAYKVCTKMFKNELERDGALQSSFHQFVNSYIMQISQRAICNNHHRLDERFSSWLLLLEDRINCRGENKLVLTQEQIAQILGVHRPSITCIAQEFRDQGIIDYLRGRIVILNREKLELVACECYSTLNNKH